MVVNETTIVSWYICESSHIAVMKTLVVSTHVCESSLYRLNQDPCCRKLKKPTQLFTTFVYHVGVGIAFVQRNCLPGTCVPNAFFFFFGTSLLVLCQHAVELTLSGLHNWDNIGLDNQQLQLLTVTSGVQYISCKQTHYIWCAIQFM